MKKLLLVLLSILLFSSVQASDDWRKIELRSVDNTNIVINYKTICYSAYTGFVCSAKDLWVNISGGGLSENSNVRIVIQNYKVGGRVSYYLEKEVQELDLNNDGNGYFSGRVNLKTNVADSDQKISVVIDGQYWLEDPINFSHDFEFSLVQ